MHRASSATRTERMPAQWHITGQNEHNVNWQLRRLKMERKSGFYWVKYINTNDWVVRWYSQNSEKWCVPNTFVSDSELGEINENRIMSPDEW